MPLGRLKTRIVCSHQAVHIIPRKFDAGNHGSLNFVWQFELFLVRRSCWVCIVRARGDSSTCLSPTHFIFCNIDFPCLVYTPMIMFHVHHTIQIIPLVMRTPPIALSILSNILFTFYNTSIFKPRETGRISAAPLTRWLGGCGLCWISTASTRFSILQIIRSGDEGHNHSILRVGLGPFLFCNHVIELIVIHINQLIWCGGTLCLPLFILYMDKVPKKMCWCHQGAKHMKEVIFMRGTTVFDFLQILLHSIKHHNNIVAGFMESSFLNHIIKIWNTILGGCIDFIQYQPQNNQSIPLLISIGPIPLNMLLLREQLCVCVCFWFSGPWCHARIMTWWGLKQECSNPGSNLGKWTTQP